MIQQLVSLHDDGIPVTTSFAVAEGVGRKHKPIIRLIRDNLTDFSDFGRVSFENAPFETSGGTQKREVAVLNEGQALLLITYLRNNPIVREFKKRLVASFLKMREQLNQPQPNDMSRMDILQIAMAAEKERLKLEHHNQQLEQRIEQDRPHVRFAQQVEIAEDQMSVAQAAKVLGTGQRRLFSFMRKNGWVTRRNEPYQNMITSGCLDVKLGRWRHPDDGIQESVTTMVTGKGLVKLQDLMTTQNTGRLKSDRLF